MLPFRRRFQRDHGDLGRREQAHRRPPSARSARNIQLHAVRHRVKTGQKAAVEASDDPMKREKLSAVRVAGDLQIDLVLAQPFGDRRRMRQQNRVSLRRFSRQQDVYPFGRRRAIFAKARASGNPARYTFASFIVNPSMFRKESFVPEKRSSHAFAPT